MHPLVEDGERARGGKVVVHRGGELAGKLRRRSPFALLHVTTVAQECVAMAYERSIR